MRGRARGGVTAHLAKLMRILALPLALRRLAWLWGFKTDDSARNYFRHLQRVRARAISAARSATRLAR